MGSFTPSMKGGTTNMVTLGSSSQPKPKTKSQAPKHEEKKFDRYEKRSRSDKKEFFFNPTPAETSEEE
jgi:hypothetical protein